jgi:hypothetical protein
MKTKPGIILDIVSCPACGLAVRKANLLEHLENCEANKSGGRE